MPKHRLTSPLSKQKSEKMITRLAKTLFVAVVFAAFFFFYSCTSRETEPTPFSSFIEHKFNDILTSLDKGENDSLIIGTQNGKLIFYNIQNAGGRQVNVGEDKVYFAKPIKLSDSTRGMLVGVRNEGIKLFSRNFSVLKRYTYGVKERNYSVYKVEQRGNKLLCATSNGLATFELPQSLDSLTDTLKVVHPSSKENNVPADYKIDAMCLIEDSLFFAREDTLFVMSLDKENVPHLETPKGIRPQKDRIVNLAVWDSDGKQELMIIRKDSLIAGPCKCLNSKGYHSCQYRKSAENSFLLLANNQLSIVSDLWGAPLECYKLTIVNEQYTPTANMIVEDGFTYIISGSSLCQILDHPYEAHRFNVLLPKGKDDLFAFSNLKRVYHHDTGMKEDFWEHEFVINAPSIKGEVTQAIMVGDTIFIINNSKIFFRKEEKRNDFKPLAFESQSPFHNDGVKKIHYAPNTHQLFISYRNRLIYGTIQDGKLVGIKSDSILSIQCFEQNGHKLYIGTLNDGCIVKDLTNNELDTLFRHKDSTRSNIVDMLVLGKKRFVLTATKLFFDDLSGKNKSRSIDVRDFQMARIVPYGQDSLIGISKVGGVYLFRQDSLSDYQLLYPDIVFNPEAISVQSDLSILAGTNIGLIKISQTGILSKMNLDEPWYVDWAQKLKPYLESFIKGGVPVAIALIIIITALFIVGDVLRQRYKQMKIKYNSDIESVKQLQTQQRESLLNHPFLNLKWKIADDDMSESIMIYEGYRTYQDEKKKLEEKINEVPLMEVNFSSKMDAFTHQVQQVLFSPTLCLHAYLFREWSLHNVIGLLKKEAPLVKVFNEQLDLIVADYLRSAIQIERREEITQHLYLRICAAALILNPQETSKKKNSYEELKKLRPLFKSNVLSVLVGEQDIENFYTIKSKLRKDCEYMRDVDSGKKNVKVYITCNQPFVKEALDKLFSLSD